VRALTIGPERIGIFGMKISHLAIMSLFQDDNSILTDTSHERDGGNFYDQLFATNDNDIFSEILSDGI
jgi:hypothetical protein